MVMIEKDYYFIRDLIDQASAPKEVKHKLDQCKAPVITKYEQEGEPFAPHNDVFLPTKGTKWEDLGGQRVVTVITHLNMCEKGGEKKILIK